MDEGSIIHPTDLVLIPYPWQLKVEEDNDA